MKQEENSKNTSAGEENIKDTEDFPRRDGKPKIWHDPVMQGNHVESAMDDDKWEHIPNLLVKEALLDMKWKDTHSHLKY